MITFSRLQLVLSGVILFLWNYRKKEEKIIYEKNNCF